MSSRIRIPPDWEVIRLRCVFGVMLLGFGVIAATLWREQVSHGEQYSTDLMKQSVRRVRMPGIRGLICDREGRALAENRPSFGIALYLEELRPRRRGQKMAGRIQETLDEVSARLGIPRELKDEEIATHIRKRLPLPLVAWNDLDDAAVARWAESAARLPGTDLYPQAVRVYPERRVACHLLGYVGRADFEQDEEDPYHYYLPEMAGKSGLEKVYDPILRGEAGGRLVRVDVGGFRYGELGGRDPRAGQDIQLTLDLRIQKLAEEALGGEPGAVVVLDPNSGDVLALASEPGYDPNSFIPAVPTALWRELNGNPLKPLVNRAVAGAYPPGSTFKPVTALAALTAGARPGTAYDCPGHFDLGRARFKCWDVLGHGPLVLRDALKHSCNVYFFHMALACGGQAVSDMARAAGLGARTGLDLDYEAPGLVPDDAWKRRVWKDGWRDGDTCNMAIGQGFLTATPLQMAMLAATLANGGTLYRPRLLRATRPHGEGPFDPQAPVRVRNLGWNPADLKVVREGMRDVVMAEDGTGRRLRVTGATLAGKTGTAEYGIKGEGKKRGWMIAFGPYEAPRYAVAMILEDAVSGGLTVAPRLQRLFDGILHPEAATPPEGRG